MVGYFSKEKASEEGFNLACILTLPAYQRRVRAPVGTGQRARGTGQRAAALRVWSSRGRLPRQAAAAVQASEAPYLAAFHI